jgi:hypothetical protein
MGNVYNQKPFEATVAEGSNNVNLCDVRRELLFESAVVTGFTKGCLCCGWCPETQTSSIYSVTPEHGDRI